MEMWDITEPLLFGQENQNKQYTNGEFLFNDDDSSSGYDSTDISDTESVSSTSSHGSCENLAPARDDREEVMHFRSTHALCENLKLILAMPEMCDVTFLIGPNEIPVHGVRAILGTRSRVFYQLILKHMSIRSEHEQKLKSLKKNVKAGKQTFGLSRSLSERLIIPVKKYEPEVFRLLVQFVHCGTVNMTEETVAGLFCGASQFELPDLANACLEFVERCLVSRRCENLLICTRSYSHHKAAQTLFDKIYAVLDQRYTEPGVF